MRVTNRMMTNNMLSNINGNKNRLSKLEEQYSTGKRIQKPSDDPIVAVRALKLRTNLAELNQYYEKNIPDAQAWLDVTESSLKNIDSIISQMHTYCEQASNDPLNAKDRNAIAENLRELKEQIYQEGNANYAGRYVFTGFKTDTPLVFAENTSKFHYTMTEKLDFSDINQTSKIVNSVSLSQYNEADPASSDFDNRPSMLDVYRIRLAYNGLSGDEAVTVNLDPQYDEYGNIVKDASGNTVYAETFTNVNTVSASAPDAFTPADGTVNFIPETGEIIIAKDVYNDWVKNERKIDVTYSKNSFNKNELKPEHYFDCVRTEYDDAGNLDDTTEVTFTKSVQDIEYEINFNQKLKINTEGSDAISHNPGRLVDEILESFDSVVQVENKITQVERMLADNTLSDEQKKALGTMKEMLDTELVLRNTALRNKCRHGMTETQKEQDYVGVAVSDLGSRVVRLELTESRLSIQQDDFTELLSSNEDADLVDTVINYTAAETVYNASLSAAGKVVQNSLLDFL
jgi:flagellar hook-associated protein 3 FlgL